MEKYTKKTIFDCMKNHTPCCSQDDYIEVSEWHNGEGFDVQITNKSFSLSRDEFQAMQTLILMLDVSDNKHV